MEQYLVSEITETSQYNWILDFSAAAILMPKSIRKTRILLLKSDMVAMSLHSGGTGDLETGDFKHSPISQKAPVEHISDA